MTKAPARKNLKDGQSSKVEKAIITFCLLLIAGHFISSFFPEERLWGINHLAYFPLPIRILLSSLPLLIFVPKINLKVQELVDSVSHLAEQVKKPILFLLTCASSVSLFWLLRTRTHFLGDGYTWISSLKSGAPLIKWSEPLEILFHLYSYQLLSLGFKISAESVYAMLSYLAGIAFISVLFFFSKELGRTSFEKFLIFALFMLLGSSELFFGYAEHYSWVYVGVFVYLALSLRFLKGEVSILAPFLALLLCAGFHFSALYLFPSLIFLLIQMHRLKRRPKWKVLPVVALLAAVMVFYLSRSGAGFTDVFVPLSDGRSYAPDYTLFSLPHILDVINEHLLLSPFGLALLLAFLVFARRIVKFKDSVILFLVIVSISQLAYNFVIDPKFGAPRDWDLFSATAIGYSFLAVYLLIKHSKAVFNFRHTALVLISTTFFSTLPWILVNASVDRSIQGFRNILDLDPKRSRSGHYTLAQYFGKLGMTEEVQKEAGKERELFPELSLAQSAVALMDAGKTDEAIDLFKQAIVKNPYYADAHYGLGKAYTCKALCNLAIAEINRAIELNPYKATFYEGLGFAYDIMGRPDEAIRQYKKAAKLNPEDPSMYFYRLGAAYASKGSLGEAVLSYQKSVELNPELADGWYDLGVACYKMNRLDQAVSSFEKALEIQPDDAQAHYALARALIQKGLARKAVGHLQLYLELSQDTTERPRVEKLLEHLESQ